MNSQTNMEERLWDYIDGLSSSQERAMIDELVASDAAWRAKYYELLETHELMMSTELDAPSMRFTKNVMEEISRLQIAPATKTYINKNIIRGLAIFFITLVAGFLIYGFAQVNWQSGNSGGSSLPFDITQVDYSKIFNNTFVNVFMMINVILGLFLLDRFLANKRRKFRADEQA